MRTEQVAVAALTAAAFAVLAVAGPAAALPTTCPSAALVSKELSQKDSAPTMMRVPYNVICTYKGSGIIPTRIEFETATASSFAAGEKAVVGLGLVKVSGLGKAAWTQTTGGDLQVFTGDETIKILSVLTPASKLEALARKLL
jgi:hypothetical protein